MRMARSGRFSGEIASEKCHVVAAVVGRLEQVNGNAVMNRGDEIRVGDRLALGIGDRYQLCVPKTPSLLIT